MDRKNPNALPCAQITPARRIIAAGMIRRFADRTLTTRVTEAGVTGTIRANHPRTVRHANGLEFKVIPADSPFARIARSIRQLEMADGTVWTVGAPIGWHGAGAAWRTEPPQAQTFDDDSDDACPICGHWTCTCGSSRATASEAVAAR